MTNTLSDPAENLSLLIRCPSVTPAEGGALSALGSMLEPLGFQVTRAAEREAGTPDIENLYARLVDDILQMDGIAVDGSIGKGDGMNGRWVEKRHETSERSGKTSKRILS